MTVRIKFPRPLLSAVLAVVLALGFAYFALGRGIRSASAQSILVVGSFGYLVNHPDVAAIDGVLNFDAFGNVTGTYTSRNAQNAGGTGALTGTYSIGSNGVGTLNLAFDTGLNATATIVTVSGANSMNIVFTGGIPGVAGTATRQ